MELKKWIYGAAALAVLAGCSDREIAPENVDNGFTDETSGLNSYLAVEIKLPQESGTRGESDESNDFFADGTKEEYDVKNAMIVVFKGGEDEKAATFYRAYDLVKPFFTNLPTTDQITSSYIAAIPVQKLSTADNEHYYGLVILNRNETSTKVASGTEGFEDNVFIAGKELKKGTTLSTILNYISTLNDANETEFYNNNGFFMTNAPLSNKKGSKDSNTGDIRYLADLGTRTYETMAEAKENINSCVYVERALAKLTSSVKDGAYKEMKFVDKDGNALSGITIEGTVSYALTNTNKKSYIVRNVEFDEGDTSDSHFSWNLISSKFIGDGVINNEGYRMIGSKNMPDLNSPFHGTEVNWYRTYWCKDPNYNKNMYNDAVPEDASESDKLLVENPNSDEMNIITKDEEFRSITKGNNTLNPIYCRENTFDVKHQTNGNSTMAIFRIAFKVIKDGKIADHLYIRDGDKKTIYIDEKAACSPEYSRIYNDADVQEALKQALKECPTITEGTDMVKNAEQYLDVKIVMNKTSKLLEIESISLAETTGITQKAKDIFNAYLGRADGKNESGEEVGTRHSNLLAKVNNIGDITKYEDAVSYFTIPVKHFGDFYCPWDEVIGTTTKDVYNGGAEFGANDAHAQNYLGRYGMVRNNWYDLQISKIQALGYPSIPTIDVTLSDDNKEENRYLGVEIHVLSWAKRAQNVEF